MADHRTGSRRSDHVFFLALKTIKAPTATINVTAPTTPVVLPNCFRQNLRNSSQSQSHVSANGITAGCEKGAIGVGSAACEGPPNSPKSKTKASQPVRGIGAFQATERCT